MEMTIRLTLFALTIGAMHACGSAHAAIPSCPKPVHHKHHATAPIASCVIPEPRTVLLQAPIDDLQPIGLTPLTKYTLIEHDAPAATCEYNTAWNVPGGNIRAQAPELDPGTGIGALVLLAGGICVIRGKRHA